MESLSIDLVIQIRKAPRPSIKSRWHLKNGLNISSEPDIWLVIKHAYRDIEKRLPPLQKPSIYRKNNDKVTRFP